MAVQRYSIEDPPQTEDIQDVIRWAFEQFQGLQAHIAALNDGDWDVLHVAPPKPTVGMERYADGLDWDPDSKGLGEGLYEYRDNSSSREWFKL